MTGKVLTTVLLITGFIAAMPDAMGRWLFLQKVLRDSGMVTQAAAQDRAGQDFHWNGRLSAGQTVELRGINGDITATGASGDEIEVVARKTARRSNPDEVRIEVKEQSGGLIICAVYPNRDGDQPNECGGRMNSKDNDVRVDFTIKVPAGVNFKALTVNGDVKIDDLRSNAKATTVNGDVLVATSGEAEGTTVNGDVHITMGRSDNNSPLRFTTVNGDVIVETQAGLDASFHASTVNGDIKSDFGFDTYEGKFGPKSASGRIGNGGRKMNLSTVNGSIKLRNTGSKL